MRVASGRAGATAYCSGVDVAAGEGADWRLSWSDGAVRPGLLMLARGELGHLDERVPSPAFAVTGDVAWGLVAADAVAVRLVHEDGAATEAAVVGPELDGRVAFAVELAEERPVALAAIDRSGAVLQSVELVPALDEQAERFGQRVTVRPVDRDGGRGVGRVVGEGSVGEVAWEYGVQVHGEDLHTSWQSRSPSGGGGGSGAGPMPQLAPGRIQLKGSGISGEVWHLEAVGDPSVASAALRLTTGEVIGLPALGRHLDLGVVFFAVGLPMAARASTLDALDARGAVSHRLWLAGSVSWLHASLDRRVEQVADAAAPLPAAVLDRWHSVLPGVEPAPGLEYAIEPGAVRDRWPFHPLLLPPDPGTWTIRATHHRFPMNQVVGISLVWEADGLLLAQSVAWSSGGTSRDEPNTEVRGRPARLDVLTAAVNGIDEIGVSWHEPAPDAEPLDGIWMSVTSSAPTATTEAILAFAESLTRVES